MPRVYVFADEAGDFAFERGPNISRYYIVCTVLMPDCDLGHKLLEVRRRLAWEKAPLGDYFHATKDKQAVRDAVFETIRTEFFSVQATVMEKAKAQPQTRTSEAMFYQYGWHYHLQHSSKVYLKPGTEVLITVASIGTKQRRIGFEDAVRAVARQKIPRKSWVAAFWPCQTDPCLQVADYCTWAIQRKWESDGRDVRSYNLIKDRITYEYELWKHGTKLYY